MLHYFILQLNKGLKPAQLVGRLFKKSINLGNAIKKGINTKIRKPLFKNIDLFLINHFNIQAH